MKLGEVAMESNKDNDYIARQLQSIEVTKHVLNAKHDDTENVFRSAKELDHVPSPLPSWSFTRIIRIGKTSTTRLDTAYQVCI